jgi:hypothetical protein
MSDESKALVLRTCSSDLTVIARRLGVPVRLWGEGDGALLRWCDGQRYRVDGDGRAVRA